MIIYLLIGLVWTAFIDLYLKPTTPDGLPMNNLNRIVQLLGWPIWMVVFIYGFLAGIGKKNDEDLDNE